MDNPMKKTTYYLLTTGLVFLNLLALGAEPGTRPPVSGAVQGFSVKSIVRTNGLELSLAIDTNRMERCGQVLIKVTLVNLRTNAIEVWSALTESLYCIEVSRASGKVAPHTQFGKHRYSITDVGPRFMLKVEPNKSISDTLQLDRLYDMTMFGEYVIRTTRKVWMQPAGSFEVLFDPIRVTLNDQ
jgi:hypothetical protein